MLVGHALVLALGFVLVVPGMTARSAGTQTVAAQYSGYVLWTGPVRTRNASVMREVAKASTLEEQPAPAIVEQAPTIATRVAPTTS